MTRIGWSVVLGVLAAAITVVAPPASRAGETVPPTSAEAVYAQERIELPERSLAFDRVDASAGCGAATPGRRRVDGSDRDWRGEPTWIAGTARHDRGELIWTDYPYDDDGTGALTYPGEGEPLETREGMVGWASPRNQRYGANAADVVEIRFAADQRFLYVLARFNFLNATDSTVLGLAFDSDPDLELDEGRWPRGARVATPGAEVFVTLHGACGFVTTADGERSLAEVGGAAAVSTAENLFEAAIPREMFGAATTVRVAGGAGVWDPAGQSWMTPQLTPRGNRNATDMVVGAFGPNDPAVFNLLFRDDEPLALGGTQRTFQTTRQQETLRGGTTGPYQLTVDFDRLRIGRPDPLPLRRGDDTDFVRVYESRLEAEGVIQTSGSTALFLGRYQPYGVFVPDCVETSTCPWPSGGAPVAVALHGGGGDHVMFGHEAIRDGGTELYGVAEAQRQLAAATGAMSVRPLGRGQRPPWWRGVGELDVLEVLEDVHHHYGTDLERQVVAGGSLGGYGTVRFASLYPDLFSGAFAHCPASYENSISARIIGNVEPDTQPFVINTVMPSMLHVPYRQATGTGDPLVPVTANHRLRDSALAAELDFGYTEYLAGNHCFDPAAAALPWIEYHTQEMAALLQRARTVDPARVRYVVDPRHHIAAPEPIGVFDARDLGLDQTGAYWVSGLEARPALEPTTTPPGPIEAAIVGILNERDDVAATAMIDTTSRMLPGWQLQTASCGEGFGLGDGNGGNPYLTPRGPTPHLYQCQTQHWSGTTERLLEVQARNLRAAAIDLRSARLHDAPFQLAVSGDGPIALTLSGTADLAAEGACLVSVDGRTLHLEATEAPCILEVHP